MKLAGGIAEAMLEGRQVPSWGELLTAEGLEPRDAELYEGSVVLPFFAPLVKWHNGNVDAARSSVTRILTESRQETIFDLRNNWPAVLRRARQLDDKWKARTT